MASIDNAAVVREVYDAFNAREIDRLAGLAYPDAQVTLVPFGQVLGWRENFENWASGFPDGRIELVSIVAQGDRVMTEFIGRGTHTGAMKTPMGDLAPTGRRAELRFVDSFEMRGGKVANGRSYFDGLSFMAQLGLGPQMPQAQARPAPQPQPRH